jgi:hypothetical protein
MQPLAGVLSKLVLLDYKLCDLLSVQALSHVMTGNLVAPCRLKSLSIGHQHNINVYIGEPTEVVEMVLEAIFRLCNEMTALSLLHMFPNPVQCNWPSRRPITLTQCVKDRLSITNWSGTVICKKKCVASGVKACTYVKMSESSDDDMDFLNFFD